MASLGRQHLDDPVVAHLRRDVTRLQEDQTIDEALAVLRSQPLGEKIVYFYVVDAEGRLRGVLPTRRLLMSEGSARVGSVMATGVVTLPVTATVREALQAFVSHRFLAIPVVDARGSVEGVVDVQLFTDEIADLSEEREDADVFQLIGVHIATDRTAWNSFRARFPWLLANVAGGLVAAIIATLYESLLDAVVVLAVFIPVVLALAESVSVQSVTLTIQTLHQRLGWRRFGRALALELGTAMMLGTGCGALVGAVAWVWKGNGAVAAAVGVAILLSMVTACVLGVALPATLRALQRDPKVAAGPIVLALADTATLIFYFNLAGMLLPAA